MTFSSESTTALLLAQLICFFLKYIFYFEGCDPFSLAPVYSVFRKAKENLACLSLDSSTKRRSE